MLERAAGSEPVGFGTDQVRRRVRRRSRARRAGAAMVVLPVLVGTGLWGATAVTDDPTERVEVADGGNEGIGGGLGGRWTPIAYTAVTVGRSSTPTSSSATGGRSVVTTAAPPSPRRGPRSATG